MQVTVGIDLGTSSTKVCFRRSDETRPTPYVCLFEENPEGYPAVVLPSTVRVVGGKVYFAAEAEHRAGGTAYRSFKTCLRCKLVKRRCLHCQSGGSPGQRVLPDEEGSIGAEELAAWYLSYVIALINKRVREQPGHEGELWYNLAAPMDVIQEKQGRDSYARVLFTAEQMAREDVVEQGAELDLLRSRYQFLGLQDAKLPPESERRTHVVDENCGGLVAFTNSRTAEDGRYALVDVGAGTTDMSIFDYTVRDRHQQFYSAGVCPFGADRVDELVLADAVAAGKKGQTPDWLRQDKEMLARIRVAKQGNIGGPTPIPRAKSSKSTQVLGWYCEGWLPTH